MTLDNWYRAHSGVMLDLASPEAADIRLADVAHHLSRVCRFGGAVDEYYSVASHSCYVADIIAAEHGVEVVRAALLHDATEAFLGDMISGLKAIMPEYKTLERRWDRRIGEVFGLVERWPKTIKDADLRARLSECRDLFGGAYPRALLLGGEGDRQPWPTLVRPETPDEAELRFLAYAHRLGVDGP